MDTLILSLNATADLISRMGSIMFISLFGIELFMQMGLMTYLKPIGISTLLLTHLTKPSQLLQTFRLHCAITNSNMCTIGSNMGNIKEQLTLIRLAIAFGVINPCFGMMTEQCYDS